MGVPSLPTLYGFVTELLPDAQLALPERYLASMSSREEPHLGKIFNMNVEMRV